MKLIVEPIGKTKPVHYALFKRGFKYTLELDIKKVSEVRIIQDKKWNYIDIKGN